MFIKKLKFTTAKKKKRNYHNSSFCQNFNLPRFKTIFYSRAGLLPLQNKSYSSAPPSLYPPYTVFSYNFSKSGSNSEQNRTKKKGSYRQQAKAFQISLILLAKISVASLFVINMPTRELLAGETKNSFV